MEVILDDLASKSRVLYDEGKFKEVEEMFNTFIKESGKIFTPFGVGTSYLNNYYTASRKLRALWASKVFVSSILVFSTLGHIHTRSKKPAKNFDSKKSISVEKIMCHYV